MARYRLTASAVIDDRLYEPGDEIEFDGPPGPHMEPIDAPAKQAAAAKGKEERPAIDPDMRAHPDEDTTPGTGRRDRG